MLTKHSKKLLNINVMHEKKSFLIQDENYDNYTLSLQKVLSYPGGTFCLRTTMVSFSHSTNLRGVRWSMTSSRSRGLSGGCQPSPCRINMPVGLEYLYIFKDINARAGSQSAIVYTVSIATSSCFQVFVYLQEKRAVARQPAKIRVKVIYDYHILIQITHCCHGSEWQERRSSFRDMLIYWSEFPF